MGYYSRLSDSFEGAIRLPLTHHSKYVLFSDCHRGVGTSNDNFLKNQNLYFAALQQYYRTGYTYIELGDGDELWENRSMEQIIEAHSNVFWLLARFREHGRLYMLYGNHDMVKKSVRYTARNCSAWHCCSKETNDWEKQPLFPNMTFHAGIILAGGPMDIYLTHGHQTDLLNSAWWLVSRFLVRYLWKPLERFGVLDPTSAARNYTRKRRIEERLSYWAKQENRILITGHTHRPVLLENDKYYCNTGSCVHPRCVTCLEIDHSQIRLVKWALNSRPDMSLYVAREVLSGPFPLDR